MPVERFDPGERKEFRHEPLRELAGPLRPPLERVHVDVPRVPPGHPTHRVVEAMTNADEDGCRCGLTEARLNAAGRQLYVCDDCGACCCSEHSSNGEGLTVYCDTCTEDDE